MRRMLLLGLYLWPLCRVPCARCQVVINELLPDPEGSDGGWEFVEFHNRGPGPVSLDRVSFQFANGAEAPDWLTRWTGSVEDSVPAGGFFLLADHNWQGQAVPDAQCRLGLQNGPDAVRLVRKDVVLDLVGYGPLTESPFFEGNPAPVAPGRALARRPDGNDTDDNAADFRLTTPTPGQRNFQDYQLDLSLWSCDPPHADRPGREHRVRAVLINSGLLDLTAGSMLLDCQEHLYKAAVADLPPGNEVNVQWLVRPAGRGRHALTILCPLPETGDTLAVGLGTLQVGTGLLALNEVQPAPTSGQGEWIEVVNRSALTLDLDHFRIKDEDGVWRSLPAYLLPPEGLVAVAQDSSALRSWLDSNAVHQDPALAVCSAAQSRILNLKPWPNLNNSPAVDRDFADRIYLADSLGVVVDHLTLGPGGESWDGAPIPAGGLSLERLAVSPADSVVSPWAPCSLGSGGTPGCPNSFAAPAAAVAQMVVTSRVLDRTQGPTSVGVTLVVDPGGLGFRLRVFDLWGEQVRELGGDGQGPGLRIRYWTGDDEDGRPVPVGGYILVGEVIGTDGVVLSRSRQVVGVR